MPLFLVLFYQAIFPGYSQFVCGIIILRLFLLVVLLFCFFYYHIFMMRLFPRKVFLIFGFSYHYWIHLPHLLIPSLSLFTIMKSYLIEATYEITASLFTYLNFLGDFEIGGNRSIIYFSDSCKLL